jgi:hypothetical protein
MEDSEKLQALRDAAQAFSDEVKTLLTALVKNNTDLLEQLQKAKIKNRFFEKGAVAGGETVYDEFGKKVEENDYIKVYNDSGFFVDRVSGGYVSSYGENYKVKNLRHAGFKFCLLSGVEAQDLFTDLGRVVLEQIVGISIVGRMGTTIQVALKYEK